MLYDLETSREHPYKPYIAKEARRIEAVARRRDRAGSAPPARRFLQPRVESERAGVQVLTGPSTAP